MPTGNSTIFFIHPSEIPTHKKVTYVRLVVDIRPLKEGKYCVHITVGGDKLDFCGDASSVAASLATVKLLLNSVVSIKGAKFTTADIKTYTLLYNLLGTKNLRPYKHWKKFLPRYSTSNNPSAYPSNSGTPRNCSSVTKNTTIHLS